MPAAVRYLVPGAVAGLVSFAFSRVMIEPLVRAAVEYEGEREHVESELSEAGHSHGHELFTRAVQENLGAAVGIVGFAIVMGVLFAAAYSVIRPVLERRGLGADPTAMALMLALAMFAAIVLIPSLKYPANPPTVGLDETTGARSSAFLTMTALSVVCACGALAAGLSWVRRWGAWRSTAFAVGGYVAVMIGVMMVLPSFHEVPGPLSGPDGLLLDGFPAAVLADFRVYTLVNHALMWLVIGVTWVAVAAGWQRMQARRSEREAVSV